jgi:hypothetical protein
LGDCASGKIQAFRIMTKTVLRSCRSGLMVFALAALLTPVTHATAATVATSFDADSQGWRAAGNGGGPITWLQSGSVSISDQSDGWAYFAAPASYLQAMRRGAALEFDLRHTSDAQHPAVSPVRVALVGAGLNLVAEHALPTFEWSTHRFVFDSLDTWRILPSVANAYDTSAAKPDMAQWRAVLESLSSMYISADYSAANAARGGFERTEIDNVRLAFEPARALSAPGTSSLMISALLAGAAVRSRFFRRR